MLHICYLGNPKYSTQVASDILKGQTVLLAATAKRFAVKQEDLKPY